MNYKNHDIYCTAFPLKCLVSPFKCPIEKAVHIFQDGGHHDFDRKLHIVITRKCENLISNEWQKNWCTFSIIYSDNNYYYTGTKFQASWLVKYSFYKYRCTTVTASIQTYMFQYLTVPPPPIETAINIFQDGGCSDSVETSLFSEPEIANILFQRVSKIDSYWHIFIRNIFSDNKCTENPYLLRRKNYGKPDRTPTSQVNEYFDLVSSVSKSLWNQTF